MQCSRWGFTARMEGGIISLRVILRDLFQPKQFSRCWWVSGEPKQAAESPHTDLTVRGVTRCCGKPSSAFPVPCKCLSLPGNAHREALRAGPPGQAFPEGAEIQGLPGRLLALHASSVVAWPAHSTALLPTSQPHGGLSPAPSVRPGCRSILLLGWESLPSAQGLERPRALPFARNTPTARLFTPREVHLTWGTGTGMEPSCPRGEGFPRSVPLSSLSVCPAFQTAAFVFSSSATQTRAPCPFHSDFGDFQSFLLFSVS